LYASEEEKVTIDDDGNLKITAVKKSDDLLNDEEEKLDS
jgi:hypothetical protein